MKTLRRLFIFRTWFAVMIALAPFALSQPPRGNGNLPYTTALLTSPQSVDPQNTEIASVAVDMWSTDTETRGVFTQNVVVTGTNLRLTCDRLEVTATTLGDKTATVSKLDKFKYLLATGNVHIIQGAREAWCGKAEVFPREDRVVLTDHPRAIDHESEVTYTGEELYLYRGQRRVAGKNPTITFPPIKDLGFDKNAPAPHRESEKKEDNSTAPKSDAATPTPAPQVTTTPTRQP